MGRSSTGCRSCVRRRVKCDEGQPVCQRCQTAGLSCDGPQLETRNATTRTISNRLQIRRRRNKAAEKSGRRINSCLESVNDHTLVDCDYPPILLTAETSIFWFHDEAIALFVSQFVAIPEINGSSGWLSFIPDYHRDAHSESCIQNALTAVAYVNFANQTCSTRMSLRATQMYGKAITSVNLALNDPQQTIEDGTILAVLFLGLYEMITADKPRLLGAHGRGLSSLLHLRGPTQLSSPIGREIFRIVCAYLLNRSLSHRTKLSDRETSLIDTYSKNDPSASAFLSILRICQAVASAEKLISDIKWAERHQSFNFEVQRRTSLSTQVSKMILIDQFHRNIFDILPAYTKCQLAESFANSNHAPLERQDYVLIYKDPWIANMWNWLRSTRIVLQCTIFKSLQILFQRSVEQASHQHPRTEALKIIMDMIGDICATLPYIMGDLDSPDTTQIPSWSPCTLNCKSSGCVLLLWHLDVMERSGCLLPHQYSLVQRTRRRIVLGRAIRQALPVVS